MAATNYPSGEVAHAWAVSWRAVSEFTHHSLNCQRGRPCLPRDVEEAAQAARRLVAELRRRTDDVRDALRGYTTGPNVADEVRRSEQLLESVASDPSLFLGRVPLGVGFMPRNQLLYSLFYMAVIPALCCDRFVLRPPAVALHHVQALIEALALKAAVPGLELVGSGYREFVSQYARGADVVVFTGSSATARRVRGVLTGSELFIASGSGHNPVVVTADADLGDAARRIVRLALYNQGQDCSAPSAVLCNSDIATNLVAEIEALLAAIRLEDGQHAEWERIVGPNTDAQHVRVVRRWLAELSPWIVTGGQVAELTRLIEPTVLVRPLSDGPMYREWFAPIIVVQPYETIEQLRGYFIPVRYRAHAMYLTKLGRDSGHELGVFATHPPDTVLEGTDLHEHERGDRAYGGYGDDASYLALGHQRVRTPVLPQREIAVHLLANRLRTARTAGKTPPTARRRLADRQEICPQTVELSSQCRQCSRTCTNEELKTRYAGICAGESSDHVVTVAGRVLSIRNQGAFIDVHDGSAKLQLHRESRGSRADMRAWRRQVHLRDIVQATGHVGRTRRGELTVLVDELEVVTKTTARPARYAPVFADPERRAQLYDKAHVLDVLRQTLRAERFVEAQSPSALSTPAQARPEAQRARDGIGSLPLRPNIRSSLRQLLVHGLSDRVYEVSCASSPSADGLWSHRVILDVLAAFASKSDMIARMERLMRVGSAALGCEIATLEVLRVPSEVSRVIGEDVSGMEASRLRRLSPVPLEMFRNPTWGEILWAIFRATVKGSIEVAAHVIDIPADVMRLSARSSGDAKLSACVVTMWGTTRVGVLWPELTDPDACRQAWEEESRSARQQGVFDAIVDEQHIEAVTVGMPPAWGMTVHVDGLVEVAGRQRVSR